MSRLLGKQKNIKRSFDHLILHSDAEGFYLPIEFPHVPFPDESLEIAGGMVGSSYGLLRECERIAAALEIPADLDETSDGIVGSCRFARRRQSEMGEIRNRVVLLHLSNERLQEVD